MTIYLTPDQVAELEATQSRYGCGAEDTCLACYPIQYRCEWCSEDFPAPVRNGTEIECEACGWLNNDHQTRD